MDVLPLGNRGYGGTNRYSGGGGPYSGRGGRDNDGRANSADDWTIPLPRNERVETELFGKYRSFACNIWQPRQQYKTLLT